MDTERPRGAERDRDSERERERKRERESARERKTERQNDSVCGCKGRGICRRKLGKRLNDCADYLERGNDQRYPTV